MSSDIKLSISEDERHLYHHHHHHHHLGGTNGVVNGEVLEFVMGSQYAKDPEQSGSVGEEEDRDGEFYSFEHSEDLERLGLGLTEELKIRESNERLDYNRNDLSGKQQQLLNGDSSTPTKGSDRRLSAGSSLATSANDEVDRSYGEDGGYEADQDHHYYEPHRQYHRLSVSHTGDEFSSDEDEAFVELLEKANHIAEARLAARRQARAEAREIRMRELERQQKELEQNADRVFDLQQQSASLGTSVDTSLGAARTPGSRLTVNSSTVGGGIRGSSLSSRRSSEDSLEEEGRSLRDLRHELKDVEERFRKAMVANAQLDNERASQSYQIQLLKDKLEEMEESHAQLQREFKEKCRDHDALRRANDKLGDELKMVQGQLAERDALIEEQGLVIVTVENEDGSDARRALVTTENAQLLKTVQGSLDVRLKKFAEEKQELQTEVQQLQQQLKDIKTKGRKYSSVNGALDDDDYEDAQREANKLITDYKYKLQKAEQEIANLQASLARSESQVIRYKSTAEAAEKAESDLKIERRKLQRENREAMDRLEELETCNNHLLKRLDKLKNAKSALLKDL
ncbi:leucine-rich repeat flightless-interacting protein 2 isoform X3 [Culex quinquefasciatus]|nr:leucine-rich repeat flightless-interacting protein 2 isoform X3 [Culex quinquefasciatus]XP_038105336.1 leucine-rich repeat flightless-interacting protein 2 isoform X3 [Culex quinquefasciatus]